MKRSLLLLPFLFLSLGCDTTGLIPNFHTVEKGNLYRSAQLNGKQFAKKIEKYGIKTIINLRGSSDKEWYLEEKRVAEEYGVDHIDIRMSAKRLPTKDALVALLDAYKTAQRPILIHCQAGADRTGEAAAIYKMVHQGASKKKALKQLRLRYLHLTQKWPAKRYFIKNVWQGEDWAYNEYDPCNADYKYFNKESHCKDGFDPNQEIEEDEYEVLKNYYEEYRQKKN